MLLYIMKNICDWNNCNEIGEYKAPIEKDNSRKYRMLCLEHVKEFNKNNEPINFYPLGLRGHYTPEGYKLIAETISKAIIN